MARYVATINTPGYMPQDDDPPTFDTVHEAWHWLAEERERHEDEQEQAEGSSSYSDTALCLEHCATLVVFRCEFGKHHFPEHEGSFWGPTPGTDSDHDLGLVYSVTEVEEEAETFGPVTVITADGTKRGMLTGNTLHIIEEAGNG
jgi:hypothetical protein